MLPQDEAMSQFVSKCGLLRWSVSKLQVAVLSALGESPLHQHALRRGTVPLRLLQSLDNLVPHPGHTKKLLRSDFLQIVNL